MAAILPISKIDSDSVTRTNFRTFPRSAIKRKELDPEVAVRYDRHGALINGKRPRITFVDRILHQPLHTVIWVEADDYEEVSKSIHCKCNLL